jgi:hypothetical protein
MGTEEKSGRKKFAKKKWFIFSVVCSGSGPGQCVDLWTCFKELKEITAFYGAIGKILIAKAVLMFRPNFYSGDLAAPIFLASLSF